MSKKKRRRIGRPRLSETSVEQDIWVPIPNCLLESMRGAVAPEKWVTTETDLLQNYNAMLNSQGEETANKWAARETEAFTQFGLRKNRDRLIDIGAKSSWGVGAMARLLLDIIKN